MRSLALLLVIALLGMMLGAGLSAEAGPAPTNISNTKGESKRPAVAVGADGSVHVAWEDQSAGNWEVFYASKEPDGPWSLPANVSNNSGGSFRPSIAVAADGSVHVAWHDDTPGDYEIFYAVKPPGGEWSDAANISNSSEWSYWPSIVLGAEGFVHAAWHDQTPGNWEAFSASKAPGGAWSHATNLSQSVGTSFIPTLLVAGDGAVHAVWQDDTFDAWDIFSASRPPEGPWSAPVNVSGTGTDSAPFAAAQSPDGSLRVVWREATTSGSRLLSATKTPGGPWSSPEDLGGSAGGSGRFVVGIGEGGTLYLAWDDSAEGDGDIFFASMDPGGSWSPSLNLSGTSGRSTEPALAVAAGGSIHVVWRDESPGRGDIFYSQRFPDGGGEGAVPLEGTRTVDLSPGCTPLTSKYPDSTPVELLATAVSPARSLVAMWTRDRGGWLGYSPSYTRFSDDFVQDSDGWFFVCTSGRAEFTEPS